MRKCSRCGCKPYTYVVDDDRIIPRYYCYVCFNDKREQREKEEQKEFYIKAWVCGAILFVLIMYLSIG